MCCGLFSKYTMKLIFTKVLSNEDPLRRTQWCAHAGTLAQTHMHTCLLSLCLIKNQARTVSKQQTEGDFRKEDTIEVGLTIRENCFTSNSVGIARETRT